MNTPGSKLRVAVVDDHVLFAESLELALSVEGYDVGRVEVPTVGGSAHQLVAAVVRLSPRVVLLDLDLGPFGDGVAVIRPIAASGANVVVVTSSLDRGRWGEAVHHGARAVLPKSRPLMEILGSVRRISRGIPLMDHVEREQLLRCFQEQRAGQEGVRTRLQSLSPRESHVLAHLMKGRSVREIASLGVVSEATVRTQVKAILSKLEVSSQLAAVGLAHHVDWRAPTLPGEAGAKPTAAG